MTKRSISFNQVLGDSRIVLQFAKSLTGFKRSFLRVISLNIISASIQAAIPLIWLYFVDDVIAGMSASGGNEVVTFSIVFYSSLYLLLRLANIVNAAVLEKTVGTIRSSGAADLRSILFRKLNTMSFAYFDKHPQGELMTNLADDVNNVANLISGSLNSLISSVIGFVVMLFVIFFYSPVLGLLVFLTLPFLFLIASYLQKRVGMHTRMAMQKGTDLNIFFSESTKGIAVTKSFNQEHNMASRYAEKSFDYKKIVTKTALWGAIFTPLVICVSSLSVAIVIGVGGTLTLNTLAAISVGMWAAFFGYTRGLFIPVLEMTQFVIDYQTGVNSSKRILVKMEAKPMIDDALSTGHFTNVKGQVEFRNVYFGYNEHKHVLEDFNLKIYPGESIGLVGATGGGKSTILNLLARFYEPQKGEILIDDTNYRFRSIESLRNHVGIVLQHPHILNGTLYENLTHGSSKRSNEQKAKSLLEQLGAVSLISRLHDPVGEGGSFLSTGEKQIVAIARMILRDPAILLMDEFTSSIDVLMEARIQKAVQEIMNGRTCMIIAHRLSTIRHCDRILVIENGMIAEEGPHHNLIDKKGIYHTLVQHYA